MLKNIQILPKEVKNAVGTTIGTAQLLDLAISYTVGQPMAKGYYCLKEANETPLASANVDLDTTGWAENDNVMIERFIELLNVVTV